ncbi:hypothetical protein B0H10DRAFT_2443268 [Mycena sp. CBHHK59/15]|nr:hypothetical protein B0H10DRAFT_2443268 [Mycena sp. CBHHK59/15]
MPPCAAFDSEGGTCLLEMCRPWHKTYSGKWTRVSNFLSCLFPTFSYYHRHRRTDHPADVSRKPVKMAVNGAKAWKHSPADQEFLDSLSTRDLMDFRNYMYSPIYIASNAGRFLDHEWINIPNLRDFLCRKAADAGQVASSTRPSAVSDLIHVKIEAPQPSAHPAPAILVKAESQSTGLPCKIPGAVKMRTLNEGGHDVFELLSDSEPETLDHDSDLEVSAALIRTASHSSSVIPLTDAMDADDFDDEFRDSDLVESDTIWQDEITSFVSTGNFRITSKVKVQQIEYLSNLPSIWPIHRIPTAFVVSLEDPKYDITDQKTEMLHTVDFLIRNWDNDSWEGNSGTGDPKAHVTFVPGEPPIECRRARSKCRGAFACENVDPTLLSVDRYELDTASRDAVLAAQGETRRSEGTTPEQNAVLFMDVVRAKKCDAIDSDGNKCQGGPMMKSKPQGKSHGHQYFIACSGWTPKFNEQHRAHSIPDNVDENLLAKLFAGQPLTANCDRDTRPCSRLVHPNTGLKQHFCPHAHITNGNSQARSQIRQYPCYAERTIYVPMDRSIRKALIVNNDTGHNHPMPTLTKVSLGVKETYRQCVKANGCIGATVSKVDNAQSTKLILKGKTPSDFAPPLHSKRVKRDLVREVKSEQFPNGLDATGAFHLYLNGLTKPLPERYIHSYIANPDGSICILTCVPFLLKLLDDPGVTSFEDDTTYKRVEGEMNEWELAIFAKLVLRAASVARAYINRASADFFEQIFDEIQRIKLLVTGKPIALKRFIPGGNLLVMNADMDAVQVLGICRSVMKHNVPEYSGIPNNTPPEKAAPHFIKICWRHSKEPIHDFKSLVSDSNYARLLDFVYIDSKETLDAFSEFVRGLGVKKIQDWWAHKEMHEWIIPCLIKSQSLIPAEVWDSTPATTNTGEAQHHWTNSLTGIKLSLVEAIEIARQVDETVAREIEASMRTGILSNPHNEVLHRMARNSQRQSTSARKARESRELTDASKQLQDELDEELEKRRQSNARTKDLKEKLKAVKETSSGRSKKGKSSDTSAIISASSSGRVKTTAVRSNPLACRLATQSNNVPAAGTPLADTMQPEEFAMSGFESAQLATQSMLDFWSIPNFDLAGLMVPSSSGVSTDVGRTPTPDFQNFDFTPIELDTFLGLNSGVDALIPTATPPQNFNTFDLMDSFSMSSLPSDFSSEFFSLSSSMASGPSFDPWPLLPLPQPSRSESPSEPSSAVQSSLAGTLPAPDAPKIRRPRKEVDEANIVTSSRLRAPTARKRDSDAQENGSDHPTKRTKGCKVQSISFIAVFRKAGARDFL